MEPVRILVAEDNAVQRERLVDSLNHQPGLRVVGAAENGIEAIRMIRERLPSVVVCDMVMPQMDGFAVLEEIAHMEEAQRPRVIALTALSRDDFITRAMNLGVSYYMVKPVDPAFLAQRILSLAGRPVVRTPVRAVRRQEESAEQTVARMLLHLGVPVHLSGYRFLLRSVLLVLEDPEMLGGITHTLYPAVAGYYNTTASRVERAIRHAINMTWARSGAANFESTLKCRAFAIDDKPTNCELIALLAERARLQGWGEKAIDF